MIVMSEQYLHSHWANEKPIKAKGESFRVGKMSYGDYFLEPGQSLGEKSDFNTGTLWPERIEKTDNFKI